MFMPPSTGHTHEFSGAILTCYARLLPLNSMDSLSKRIELFANIAIIVVAALLCVVLVKSYLLPADGRKQSGEAEMRRGLERGDTVAVPSIDWRKNGKTLLLALSTTCHFCTQSASFYQRVVKERGDAQMVALLPQPVGEGQAYLKQLGVSVADVRQVSLVKLGLSGTPTLVLVDGDGVVTDVWVGALAPSREDEVISRLRGERASE